MNTTKSIALINSESLDSWRMKLHDNSDSSITKWVYDYIQFGHSYDQKCATFIISKAELVEVFNFHNADWHATVRSVRSPRLHLFDQKYNKEDNLVKYYHNLSYVFYSCDAKLNFHHSVSHDPSEIILICCVIFFWKLWNFFFFQDSLICRIKTAFILNGKSFVTL